MATAFKVLGQAAPAATTVTALYTVPAATEAVISTITVCNQGTATATFRLTVRPDGTALADQHHIVFDANLSAKDTIFLTVGATMDASDVLDVFASTADFSFTAFGSEIS